MEADYKMTIGKIEQELLRRASEACYWKEKHQEKNRNIHAKNWEFAEYAFLEAVQIVRGANELGKAR